MLCYSCYRVLRCIVRRVVQKRHFFDTLRFFWCGKFVTSCAICGPVYFESVVVSAEVVFCVRSGKRWGDMNRQLDNVLQSLAEIGGRFESRGWFLGTSGNMSALLTRDPLTFAVTATGLDKGALGSDGFVAVNEAGEPAPGAEWTSGRKPSSDHRVHAAIYQRTNANCVLHVHTVQALLLADLFYSAGEVVLEGFNMLKGLGLSSHDDRLVLPVFPNSGPEAVAEKIVDRFTPESEGLVPAVLVHKHGTFVWGEDAFAARRHAEILMHLFEYLVAQKSVCS